MAMHADNRLIDIGYFVAQASDDLGKFVWNGIANGIRNIDGAGAGFNGSFDNPA